MGLPFLAPESGVAGILAASAVAPTAVADAARKERRERAWFVIMEAWFIVRRFDNQSIAMILGCQVTLRQAQANGGIVTSRAYARGS